MVLIFDGTKRGVYVDYKTDDETPFLNGTRTNFTLSFTPIEPSVTVLLNGLKLIPGALNDYTVSGNSVTLTEAPLAIDNLIIRYTRL